MEDINNEASEVVTKLTKRTKKIQINDDDVNEWDQVQSAFYEHFHPTIVSHFSKTKTNISTTGGSSDNNPVCLFSDLFSNQTTVLSGFSDGSCKVIDINRLSSDLIVLDRAIDWKHTGLSCIRSSRMSPHIFFTSSSLDSIRGWDTRESNKTPCQKFLLDTDSSGESRSHKPILQFDISCNDQILCGGTALVKEDSYLLFWDIRSTKLLGAYWESHSDDVTSVRFHPEQVHCLASGSTDGLLNIFDLKETAEEDALQFSFNTNSSVDTVHWPCSKTYATKIACITHMNDVQVWDSISGDHVTEIKRHLTAEAMMRSNPEAVYISSCHNLNDTSKFGLMTCSLSGGCTRLIEVSDELKPTSRGLFLDQTSVIQTAQLLPMEHRWITFDDNGIVKVWDLKPSSSKETKSSRTKNNSSGANRSKRVKPYTRGD